jgi:hypothetical protein
VTDLYTQGIMEDLDRRESGQTFDIEVDQFGVPRYVGTQEMFQGAEDQPSLPASMTRRERRGQEPTITPEEGLERFSKSMAGAAAGVLPGMIAGSVGVIPDLGGLIYGGLKAAGAEEGERLQAFSEGFGNIITANVGSDKLLDVFGELVDILPVSEEVKEGLKGGATAGSFAGVPVGGTALARGAVKGFNELADAVKGMQAENYVFPYDALPQRTVVADNLESWNELQQNLKFSQPIESVEDAIEIAQRNQAVLADNGPKIQAQTGATFKDPGVKGESDQGRRMAEKIADKGNVRELTDVTRAGFAVDSPAQADQVVDLLAQNYKVIDEGYNVYPVGYFDRKILIVNPNGQIGEVQIWPKEMFSAKLEQGGQDLYVIIRDKESSSKQIAKAVEDSVDLYSAALNTMAPDMRQIALDSLNRTVAKGGENAEQAQMVLDKLRAAQ